MSRSVGESRVEVPGGSVWYRVVGGGDGAPVVLLHGGPGFPSVSLQPLEALGSDRPVVFYDQLGCGNSDRRDDEGLWTVERSVEELQALLGHLGLDDVHVLGHSWGTMLAIDHYLSHPGGVRSMVLVSPALSASRWTADCERLISQLPADLRAIHADSDASDEEIERLNEEFMRRHVFRSAGDHPARVAASEGFGVDVYRAMWGTNEFTPSGVLKDYDRTADLSAVDLPVLYVCGLHDEATPESTRHYASLTPDARVTVFDDSGHFSHLEQTGEFIEAVSTFLAAH